MYSDLGKQRQLKETYSECIVAETSGQFSNTAFKISNTTVHGRGVEENS